MNHLAVHINKVAMGHDQKGGHKNFDFIVIVCENLKNFLISIV